MTSFDKIHSQLKTLAQEGQHTLLSPTLTNQLILQLGKHSGGHLIRIAPYSNDELVCRIDPPSSPPGHVHSWERIAHDQFIGELKAFIQDESKPAEERPTL